MSRALEPFCIDWLAFEFCFVKVTRELTISLELLRFRENQKVAFAAWMAIYTARQFVMAWPKFSHPSPEMLGLICIKNLVMSSWWAGNSYTTTSDKELVQELSEMLHYVT